MELVFIRHGQSEWNAKNLFTGWRDVKLSEQGLAEAATAGKKLKENGYEFDIAFTSVLTRAMYVRAIFDDAGKGSIESIRIRTVF